MKSIAGDAFFAAICGSLLSAVRVVSEYPATLRTHAVSRFSRRQGNPRGKSVPSLAIGDFAMLSWSQQQRRNGQQHFLQRVRVRQRNTRDIGETVAQERVVDDDEIG